MSAQAADFLSVDPLDQQFAQVCRSGVLQLGHAHGSSWLHAGWLAGRVWCLHDCTCQEMSHWGLSSQEPCSEVPCSCGVAGVQVKGVILDPSCSGSGTTVSRMDHLLPGSSSAAAGAGSSELDEQEQQRVEQLAKFQVSLVQKPG